MATRRKSPNHKYDLDGEIIRYTRLAMMVIGTATEDKIWQDPVDYESIEYKTAYDNAYQKSLKRGNHAEIAREQASNIAYEKVKDSGTGKDYTTELEIEIGVDGYKHLKSPAVKKLCQQRAEQVLCIASETKLAYKRRDVEAVGVLCIRLATMWEYVIAAAYSRPVHQVIKNTYALRDHAQSTKRTGDPSTEIEAYLKRHPTHSQEAAINHVMKKLSMSRRTIFRRIKKK